MSTVQKTIVFTLTFFSYAGLHCLREGWSYSKKQLQNQFQITSGQLGLVDTLYLISYSLGMATLGNISSKIGLTIYVAVGMILSSVFYMMSPITYLLSHNFSYPILVVAMCLNGFFQSTGWPGLMGIVGNWFGKGKRGLLMGFWAVNANAGNIMALIICNILDQQNHLPWTSNFLVTGGFTIFIAVLCLILLKQKPAQDQKEKLEQYQSIKQEDGNGNKQHNESLLTSKQQLGQLPTQNSEVAAPKKEINVFTALLLPRVPFYVIGYACTKGCIYGLLFWLPTYLDNKGLAHEKGYIATMVDVGTFIGGMTVGYLGDRYSYRALFLSPLFIVASGVMFLVSFALTDIAWTYYVSLLLIGLMLGGPYNIIGTAIAIDIGEQSGKANIAKVSALIEGSAAVFAACSQIIISIMPFQYIFYLFCGQCLIAAISLFPLFLRDFKSYKNK